MANNVPITVAHGDGIGPEIMDATLHILKEAGGGALLKQLKSARKFIYRETQRELHPKAGNLQGEQKFFFESSDYDSAGRQLQQLKRGGSQDFRQSVSRCSF